MPLLDLQEDAMTGWKETQRLEERGWGLVNPGVMIHVAKVLTIAHAVV